MDALVIPVLTDAPDRFEQRRADIELRITTDVASFVTAARETSSAILVLDHPDVPNPVVADLAAQADILWIDRHPLPDALALYIQPLAPDCDLFEHAAWLRQYQTQTTIKRLRWAECAGLAWDGVTAPIINDIARTWLAPLGADLPDVAQIERLLRSAGTDITLRTTSGRQERVRVRRLAATIGGRKAALLLLRPADTADAAMAEQLIALEQRYRTIVEHSLQGILVVQDMRIVFANPAFAQITGRSVNELQSLAPEQVRAMIHPDDQPWVWGRLQRRLAGHKEPRHYQCRTIRADGSTRWLDMYADLVVFDGRPAVQAAVIDVTDEQQLRLQLTARERLSTLGTLAASVAHEINNPLMWIRNNLVSIRDELDTLLSSEPTTSEVVRDLLAELRDLADDAEQGAAQIRDITRALSLFSRSDRDRDEPVDVEAAIRFALTMAKNDLRHRASLELNLDVAERIIGRQGSLTQVVLNLLLNAAEAIEPGHIRDNTIAIRARTVGDEIRISVRDTGRGIAPDDLPRVFEPFFSTKKRGEGTGLGLTITRQLIEELGGTLHVESRLGQGTTVTVTIPVTRADPATKTSQQPEMVKRHGGRLLLLEDQPEVRRSLATVLAPHFDITAVGDVEAAKAAIGERGPFQIIAADVMLADGSGLEFANWLKENDPDQAARLVFLTGGVFDEATRARVLASGFPVIEKGDAPEELVRNLLERVSNRR